MLRVSVTDSTLYDPCCCGVHGSSYLLKEAFAFLCVVARDAKYLLSVVRKTRVVNELGLTPRSRNDPNHAALSRAILELPFRLHCQCVEIRNTFFFIYRLGRE